jgi:hypothetical protein
MKRSRRSRVASGLVAFGLAVAFTAFAFSSSAQNQEQEQQGEGQVSEIDVWRAIIHDSIASYPHLCPCPYSPNRAGRACGSRSAYSRVGNLTCYVTDISNDEIESYRLRLRARAGTPSLAGAD